MGVNMPAKTVVFTAIRKFDGLEYRIVNSGEYIQMAGRAGRRGLDDRGIVIIMFDEQVDPEEAKQLFMGQASPLLSTFHLGFNMLLNLFRIEDANPSFMITRSFAHFQRNRRALQLEKEKDELQQKVKEAEGDIHALALVDEEHRPTFDVDIAIRKYYELKHDLDQVNHQLRELIMQEKYIVRYLQAGRIIRLIEEDGTDWGWSTCVSKITRKYLPSTNAVLEAAVEELVIHCIVACDSGDTPDQSSSSSSSSSSNHSTHDKSQKKSNESSKENGVGSKGQGSRREKEGKEGDSGPSAEKNSHGSNVSLLHKLRPARRKVRSNADASPDRKDYILKVLPFPLRAIQSISKCRMTIPPGVDVEHSQDLVKSLYFQFKKVEDKFAEEGGLPLLDPIEDMHISEPKLKTLKSQAERLQEELQKNPFFNHPLCEVYFNAHEERMWMETKLRKLHESIDTQRQLVMK
ncbi:superkiller viralicidic activity 2 family, partial [Cystoisospora suis]